MLGFVLDFKYNSKYYRFDFIWLIVGGRKGVYRG